MPGTTDHDAVARVIIIAGMRSHALCALGRTEEAADWYAHGLAEAEEPDVRTRLLTALGGCLPSGRERTELLHEALALRGNLVAAATAQLILRTESGPPTVH